jgi:hypothetical protein
MTVCLAHSYGLRLAVGGWRLAVGMDSGFWVVEASVQSIANASIVEKGFGELWCSITVLFGHSR